MTKYLRKVKTDSFNSMGKIMQQCKLNGQASNTQMKSMGTYLSPRFKGKVSTEIAFCSSQNKYMYT